MSPKSTNPEKSRGTNFSSPLYSIGKGVLRCERCKRHLNLHNNLICFHCQKNKADAQALDVEDIRLRRTRIKRARTSLIESRERHNLERSLFSKTHGCPGPGGVLERSDEVFFNAIDVQKPLKHSAVPTWEKSIEDRLSTVSLELNAGQGEPAGTNDSPSELDIARFSSRLLATRLWEGMQAGPDTARIICMDGPPASGKTHFLWAITEYIKRSAGDQMIVATLFHSRDREFNPKVMYDRLALQIREQCTPALLRQIDVEGLKLGRPSSHQQKWNLWRQILKMVSLQKPILLILDGLPADDIFQRFTLREILQLCAGSPSIKCIVSSRNGQAAGLCNGIPFNRVSHISLDHDEEIQRDISISVSALLNRACSQRGLRMEAHEIPEYTEAILKKSGGTFLPTEMLLNHVLQTIQTASCLPAQIDINTVVNSLPNVEEGGMKRLYDHSLNNVPESSLSLTKELLSWCLSAKRPITKMELIEILNLKDDPETGPVTNKDVANICEERMRKAAGWLVKFDENEYAQFVHGSVRDHLTGTKSRFQISGLEANEALAITAINYLSNCNLRIDLQSECKHRRSVSEYMVIYMPEHCEQIEQENSSVPGFLLHFMKERFSKFKVWMEVYAELKQIPLPKFRKGEYIRICATFGFFTLTKMLIDLGVDPNGMPNRRTPLEAAIENKHTKIAKLLIENGAHKRRARTW